MSSAPEWELFDFQYQDGSKYLQMWYPAEAFQRHLLSAEGSFLLMLAPEKWSSLNLTLCMPLAMPNYALVTWWEWWAHGDFSMRYHWPCHSEWEPSYIKLSWSLAWAAALPSPQPQGGNMLRQSLEVGMKLPHCDIMLFANFGAHIENLNASPNRTCIKNDTFLWGLERLRMEQDHKYKN